MVITGEQMRVALESNPTLTLLKAYSRDWVLPLFADYLEQAEGSVSAEWFHERVAEARVMTYEEALARRLAAAASARCCTYELPTVE